MTGEKALAAVPDGLRNPLIEEYQSIVQNYTEHRWSPAELSGGRFCEIVYTILDGHARGIYAATPSKPANFVGACRQLEQDGHVPRSFQILIPRFLPAIYEVRNNRGVGHVGGDVDPNHMDATFVMNGCNWVMGELVRVFHDLTTKEAQALVDSIVERRTPLIWEGENIRRILDPNMVLKEQILVLLTTSTGTLATADLLAWTETKNRNHFNKVLRQMHTKRYVEISADRAIVQLLPPGSIEATKIVQRYTPH